METLVLNCLAISVYTANRKQSSPNRFEQNQHTPDSCSEICDGPYFNKQRAMEGFWETHLQWNYSMLNQTHYRKRVLQILQTCTTQSNKILQQPSIFQLTGMIYAMVILPTNKMFVIMTHTHFRSSFLKTTSVQCSTQKYEISSNHCKRKTPRSDDMASGNSC